MAENVAAPVSIAEAAFGGHVLMFTRMELAATDQPHIEGPRFRTRFLCVIKSMIVSRGKALVEVNISGICGSRIFIESNGKETQVLDRAKGLPEKTVTVPRFQ